eukprot:scaffold2802_cov110-Isochrysis_galbana.AAC.13
MPRNYRGSILYGCGPPLFYFSLRRLKSGHVLAEDPLVVHHAERVLHVADAVVLADRIDVCVPEDVELGARGAQLLVKLDCAHSLGHLVHLGDGQLLARQEVRARDDIAVERDGELWLVEPQHEAPDVVVAHWPDAVLVKLDCPRPRVEVIKLVRVPRLERQDRRSGRQLRRARVHPCAVGGEAGRG